MENMREIAEEYRLGRWAEIMEERVSSGLSITAYCEREGMHENRYYYWQRKLREAAARELMPVVAATAEQTGVSWVQVKETAEKEIEASELIIEIGKCRLKATNGTDTELLMRVCKVLVSL